MPKVICPKVDCLFNFESQCSQVEIQLDPYPGQGQPAACISETPREDDKNE